MNAQRLDWRPTTGTASSHLTMVLYLVTPLHESRWQRFRRWLRENVQ